MTWGIIIPRWRPTTANELLRKHWAVRARMKKADAGMVRAYCVQCGVPDAKVRRRVRFRIVQTDKGRRAGRGLDGDACLKSGLDALVHARMLVDDSPRWCICEPPVIERGEPRTEIILEDLEN